jgi:polyhydroxyalkanoate synthesis regulator phasin
MMNYRKISLIAFTLLLSLSMQAQKKKGVVKKAPVVVVEEPQEDPRITEMREATQQIVFIDSMVVAKDEILSVIRINPESGKLDTYDHFFRSEEHPESYVYINEMGNKCFFSDENANGQMQLYTLDKLGQDWSDPLALSGINEGISETNYPFMMTDGTTFYFAAKGKESIGGYDIFVTRADSKNGQFLKPENIGMPFNSEANDYMYVIDELSNIGYFVTDRRQPEGKVCVYLFIPPTSRRTYSSEAYTDEQLRGFAEISRIANTWGKGTERKQALERLKTIVTTNSAKQSKSAINFIINDRVTYTDISQFQAPESPDLFRELQSTRKQYEETVRLLEKSRTFYAKAKPEDKRVLRKEILDAEKQYERLTADVKTLEKRIRQIENHIINNPK